MGTGHNPGARAGEGDVTCCWGAGVAPQCGSEPESGRVPQPSVGSVPSRGWGGAAVTPCLVPGRPLSSSLVSLDVTQALRVHHEVNCLTDFLEECEEQLQALKKLKKTERGLLYGVPISLKDPYDCMVSPGGAGNRCRYAREHLRVWLWARYSLKAIWLDRGPPGNRPQQPSSQTQCLNPRACPPLGLLREQLSCLRGREPSWVRECSGEESLSASTPGPGGWSSGRLPAGP